MLKIDNWGKIPRMFRVVFGKVGAMFNFKNKYLQYIYCYFRKY